MHKFCPLDLETILAQKIPHFFNNVVFGEIINKVAGKGKYDIARWLMAGLSKEKDHKTHHHSRIFKFYDFIGGKVKVLAKQILKLRRTTPFSIGMLKGLKNRFLDGTAGISFKNDELYKKENMRTEN